MSVGAHLRADVSALMTDYGRAMSLRRVAPGSYDPATGAVGSPTTTDYTGKGRLGDYSDRVIDGAMIKQGDRRCTLVLDNSAIVPSVNDRLVVGSDVYVVVNVKTREIGGT